MYYAISKFVSSTLRYEIMSRIPSSFKVLIIEDEPLAAKRLARLIQEVEPEAEILDTIDTVNGAVNWLENNRADVIFMDIHLADGISFSIFEAIEINTPIIFSTAYDKYAIEAFKVNSIDYLLKPIERSELERALLKFRQSNNNFQVGDIKSILESMYQPTTTFKQRFIVTSGEKIKSIHVGEIAYFFGQQKYVFLITKEDRHYIVDYTLTKLEEILDPNYFFRINRQFIIHIDAIENMFAYSKSRIKIDLTPTPEIEAIVSIDKSRKFKDWLNR